MMPDDVHADSLHERATPYRSSAVPTPELIDELYREEVLDARKMSGKERLLLGQQLFEAACRITLAGIQNQFPELDEKGRLEMLRKRLELQRKMEQACRSTTTVPEFDWSSYELPSRAMALYGSLADMKTLSSVSLLLVTAMLCAASDWPQFRGPNCAGVSEDGKPPVHFGQTSNVMWKVKVPSGVSSPCVVKDRVFVTAFEEGNLLTLGFDARNGKALWQAVAPAEKIEATHKVGSPASATPASDGERVYSYFGSYGVVVYDLDGKEQWRRPLEIGMVINGSGASPALLKGRLIVNCDQQEGSFLIALDPKDGKELWRTQRPGFPSSYTTPILWSRDGRDEVVLVGSVRTVAYGLKDGKELWSVRGTEGISVAPTPVIGDGRLIVMSRAFGGSRIPTSSEFLAQSDKDGDGKVSRDEAPGYLREHGGFIATDRDKDGHLSPVEWDALRDLIGQGEHGIFAMRTPGKGDQGDLTQTHVTWKHKKGVAPVASPLLYQGRIYVVQDGGRVSCYEEKSGKILFEQERLNADGEYFASPIAANGRVYFASSGGTVIVIKAGDALNIAARNELDDPIYGTPAIVGRELFVRGANHLWAFRAE
jgi:outer membrane protein assembly factor BamB